MFLALGVGIIVGSSTNFLGINSILDRQNRVIRKLEDNYNRIRKEVRETRDQLTGAQAHITDLEQKLVPQLLAGKLEGLRLGAVVIGDPPDGVSGEDVALAPLKTAGATISYKIRISLERLAQLSEENPGDFFPQIGKELIRGKTFGAVYTGQFMKDGTVVTGNFEQPVDGIIFVLGGGLDPDGIRNHLLPIENVILENRGLTLNAAFGEQDAVSRVFRPIPISFIQNVETLRGRIDVVIALGEQYKQRKEM